MYIPVVCSCMWVLAHASCTTGHVYHADSLCTVIRNPPPPVPIEEPDVSPPAATSARALQDCGWYWGDLSRYTFLYCTCNLCHFLTALGHSLYFECI